MSLVLAFAEGLPAFALMVSLMAAGIRFGVMALDLLSSLTPESVKTDTRTLYFLCICKQIVKNVIPCVLITAADSVAHITIVVRAADTCI